MAYGTIRIAVCLLALAIIFAPFSSIPSLAKNAPVCGVSGDSVVIIDGDNLTSFGSLDIGSYPADIVANADGSKLFIIDRDGRCIKVFDMRSEKIIDSFEIGGIPLCMEYDTVKGRLLVAQASQASWKGYVTDGFCEPFPQILSLPLYLLDDLLRLITGKRPRPYDFDGLTVLDPDTGAVIDRIDILGIPDGMDMSHDGRYLYILTCPPGYTASGIGSTLSVVDLSNNDTISRTYVKRNLGNTYAGVTVSPDGKKLYVSDMLMFNGSVSVVDLSGSFTSRTINIGGEPGAIAVSPDGARVYVTYMNYLNGTYSPGIVAIIDGSNDTILQNITVGTMPSDIHVSPDGKYVYVTHKSMGNIDKGGISVIDAADGRVLKYVELDRVVDNIIFCPGGCV